MPLAVQEATQAVQRDGNDLTEKEVIDFLRGLAAKVTEFLADYYKDEWPSRVAEFMSQPGFEPGFKKDIYWVSLGEFTFFPESLMLAWKRVKVKTANPGESADKYSDQGIVGVGRLTNPLWHRLFNMIQLLRNEAKEMVAVTQTIVQEGGQPGRMGLLEFSQKADSFRYGLRAQVFAEAVCDLIARKFGIDPDRYLVCGIFSEWKIGIKKLGE